MELFIVNRHEPTRDPEKQKTLEQIHLNKIKKKIEKNKKSRQKQKLKAQKLQKIIQKTTDLRQIKREIKLQKGNIVPVPENVFDDEENSPIDATEQKSPISTEEITVNDNNQENIKPSKTRKGLPTEVEGFTILGVDNFKKRVKVKRNLPKWLANPTVISTNLQNLGSKVSHFKIIEKDLRKQLKANGIKYLFPVQAEFIPWLLETNKHSNILFPRDVCISAPTGSGKTLAYVIPLIQIIRRHSIKRIRGLVVLPTRELAQQVFQTFRNYIKDTNVKVCLVSGENSFELEQKQILSKNEAFGYLTKIDILVCTAGRLVDHLKLTEGLDLKYLEFLIVDEADRVLDYVQNDWVYHLEKHLFKNGPTRILNQFTLEQPRPPQKLLFSATVTYDPEKLYKMALFQPKLFACVLKQEIPIENGTEPIVKTENFVRKYATPNELQQKYVLTTMALKPLVLYHFIKKEKLKRTLIFTHSKESAHRLAILLKYLFNNKEVTVEEMSSYLKSKDRSEIVKKFADGKIDYLVSTDALARGIDFPNVQSVLSYSAPKYLKTYIHRVGRTARAGEQGLAVTFLHDSQLRRFKSIISQGDRLNVEEVQISENDVKHLDGHYKQSIDKLNRTIQNEAKIMLKKLKSSKRTKSKMKKYRRQKPFTDGDKTTEQ